MKKFWGLSLSSGICLLQGAWYQIGPVQLHLIVADAVIGDRVNYSKVGA